MSQAHNVGKFDENFFFSKTTVAGINWCRLSRAFHWYLIMHVSTNSVTYFAPYGLQCRSCESVTFLYTVGLNRICVEKNPQRYWLILVGIFYSGGLKLTLKKKFPLKIFAKITKTFWIFQIFDMKLQDLCVLIFLFKIHIPGKITNH